MNVPNKHIGIICTSSSWGGLEYNQFKRALRWSNKRVKVTFFCLAGTPVHERAVNAKLNVVLVNPMPKKFAFRSGFNLARLLKVHRVDVLITRDRRELSAMAFAKWFWTGETMYITAMQLTVNQKSFIHSFRYKSVDYWVALLPYLREQTLRLTKVDKSKIHLILEGVEDRFISKKTKQEARKEIGLKEDGYYIGLIGRIDPMKGQLELLEAYQQARLLKKGVQIVLLGETTRELTDAYERTLLDFKNQFELPVRFMSFMEEPSSFYRALDIQVVASHGETYGMVTVEGLVNDCIVLGANSDGTKELLSMFGGVTFEVGNVDDLATKLAGIIDGTIVPKGNKDMSLLSSDVSDEKYFELLR